VNLANALKIDGWMNDAELLWLARQASCHGMILEIGSWKGRSTRAFADHTPGLVYAVDMWESSPAGWMDPATYTKAILQKRPEDYIFQIFCDNLRSHIESGKVHPIRKSSIEAAEECILWFDLIFIDAAHDYESVARDITIWSGKLLPGGLLCGHDYSEHWPDVMKAVDDAIPHRKVVPGTSIWYAKIATV